MSKINFGITVPVVDVGGDAETLRRFAKEAENIGYHHLAATDHVIGVNAASRPDWDIARNTSDDFFHDPFVLFAFLALCATRITFATQIMILPQRKTVLTAKQAASLDVISGSRFRFGIGIGWNEIEFDALNENFTNRGRRSEEQVELMRALWAERHVRFDGKWHHVDDAGINPLPLNRTIPLWFGGHADVVLRRIAKWGDGWIMLSHKPGEAAADDFAKLKHYAQEVGRDPNGIGIEVWTSTANGQPDDWKRTAAQWAELGVTHITLNNVYGRYHHKRIAETSLDAHMRAMENYWAAVEEFAVT